MRNLRTISPLLLAAVVVVACSSSGDEKTKSQADCDAITTEIAGAEAQRGVSGDVCHSDDPAIQKDFGAACANLKDCTAHCCK